MMELIFTNKDNTNELIQFAIVLSTVCVMSMALTGFAIKKLLQMMLSR